MTNDERVKKRELASNIVVREAELRDIETLVRLWQEQHDYHVTLDTAYYEPTSDANIQDAREYFKNAVRGGNDLRILLAEDQKNTVGFITFKKVSRSPGIARSGTRIKDYGEVEDLFVESSDRGLGIGQKLMNEAENWFKQQGIKHIMVEVSASNEKTVEFYKKDGFQERQVEMFKEI